MAGDVDLTGKRIIITGGAAGIGTETARVLAQAGGEITLAVRRPDVARPIAQELRNVTGDPAIEVRQLDLSDLRSVRSFVEARCTDRHQRQRPARVIRHAITSKGAPTNVRRRSKPAENKLTPDTQTEVEGAATIEREHAPGQEHRKAPRCGACSSRPATRHRGFFRPNCCRSRSRRWTPTSENCGHFYQPNQVQLRSA